MNSRPKLSYIAVALFLGALGLAGCPAPTASLGWTYTLGELSAGTSVYQVSDGGYLVLGSGRQKNSSTYLPLVLRLAPTGGVEWSKYVDTVYGGLPVAAPGGGGFIMSTNAPYYDRSVLLRILKFDANANVLWDRTYGQADDLDTDQGQVVIATDDGGCLVACHSTTLIAGTNGSATNTYIYRVILRKLDSDGGVVWEQRFESPLGFMGVCCMAITDDGGAVIAGALSQLLRVGPDGEVLWWKQYADAKSPSARRIRVAQDGGFVLVTTSEFSFPTPEVFKTDANGNLLWSAVNLIPNQGYAQYNVRDAILDAEGRIGIVGQVEHVAYIGNFFPLISYASFVMQLDASAHLNWSKTLSAYEINGISLTDTGDYVTTGTDGADLQVIRVSKTGKVL